MVIDRIMIQLVIMIMIFVATMILKIVMVS